MARSENDSLEPDLFSGKVDLPEVPKKQKPPAAKRAAEPAVDDSPIPDETAGRKIKKNREAFKTISETARMLSLPQHVLRFWESKFSHLKPLKLKGGRRYYRPQDIEALFTIKHLLYKEGYTIKGAKRAINQARKHKIPLSALTQISSKNKKGSSPVEETPLFQSLVSAEADASKSHKNQKNASSPKKEELKEIQNELLELRKLMDSLPPLKSDA